MTETTAEQVIIIANCVVNLPLAFVAITGNALVLYGVWKTPSLRSPSMLLLCGLTSTDFSVGFIAQPIFITRSFVELFSRSVSLILIFINIYGTIALCLCGVSLAVMTAISIDRLIAIYKPLQYPSIVTPSRVTRILVAIWIVYILVAKLLVLGGATSVGFYLFICIHMLEHLNYMPHNQVQNHAPSSTADSFSDSSV